MGFDYVPKTAKIYVTTLTVAGTWYEILTAANAKAIRGIKVKSRYTYGSGAPAPFDLALKSSPDTSDAVTDGTGIWTNSGSGVGDTYGPVNGLWARSAVAGTVLEVMTFE